jgi:hypothetical protein
MRLLLACVLTLLPLAAQAEYTDNHRTNEFDPHSVTDPFIAGMPNDPDSPLNEWGPYGNPYRPASATNFEAIPTLSLYDPNQLSTDLYNPDWLSNPFGHYGHPYSPNQFNNR